MPTSSASRSSPPGSATPDSWSSSMRWMSSCGSSSRARAESRSPAIGTPRTNARMVGSPSRRPRMPLLIAGNGPKTIRYAATRGDGWVTTGGSEDDREQWWSGSRHSRSDSTTSTQHPAGGRHRTDPLNRHRVPLLARERRSVRGRRGTCRLARLHRCGRPLAARRRDLRGTSPSSTRSRGCSRPAGLGVRARRHARTATPYRMGMLRRDPRAADRPGLQRSRRPLHRCSQPRTENEPMADTAIFDVDGTLVDTNYHHALAWHRAFRRYDITPPLLADPPRHRHGRRRSSRDRRRGRREASTATRCATLDRGVRPG